MLTYQSGYLLRSRALVLGAVAFFFMLSAQLAVRYFIDLPTLRAVINESDSKDVLRVNNALAQRLTVYESRVADNALWDAAYDYIQAPYDGFISSNFDDRTLVDNELDGVMFLDAAGQIVWQYGQELGSTLDRRTMLTRAPVNDATLREFFHIPPHRPIEGKIKSQRGYVRGASSPVVFAAYPIFPTGLGDGDEMSAGTLVMWAWVGRAYLEGVAEQTQLDFNGQFLPDGKASLAPMWRYLLTGQVRARDDNNRIYWLLRDINDEPVMLLWLTLDELGMETALVSDAIVAGLLAALVLLLGLAYAVRRWLLLPLGDLELQMERITTSGSYEQRLNIDSYLELNHLAAQFNLLLEEVCEREKHAKRRQEELLQASISDVLTGLANRRHLDQFMDEAWLSCMAKASTYGLVLIDIDHFKKYNDFYGHAAGDRILKRVAELLLAQQPARDALTARYGGEEFCLVAMGISHSGLQNLCERICQVVESEGIEHKASELDRITVSIGAVLADASEPRVRALSDTNPLRTIFKAADEALYNAKGAGRNRVCMGRL